MKVSNTHLCLFYLHHLLMCLFDPLLYECSWICIGVLRIEGPICLSEGWRRPAHAAFPSGHLSGVVCFDEADARPFWAADMDESEDAQIKDRASQHAHF